MPKILDNEEQVQLPGSKYGYSRVKKENLGASEYTLVHISVDNSGSVATFANELEKCLKNAVESCRDCPRVDNLLLRITKFDSQELEHHGYKLFQDINVSDYDNFCDFSKLGGMTALVDVSYDDLICMKNLGRDLSNDGYKVNGLHIVITDGCDNVSKLSSDKIKQEKSSVVKEEVMESLLTLLVGVNIQDITVSQRLNSFQSEAGFDQYVELSNATPKSLAKLAQWISKSVSSQSKSLGSGQASQTINI